MTPPAESTSLPLDNSNTLNTLDLPFPIEIFQHIIDHVASGRQRHYIADLRACSLVCKFFFVLCQPHMLHEVEAGPAFESARNQLVDILNQKTFLRNHVERLIYSIDHTVEENLETNEDFCNNFIDLPNLQSLQIDVLYGRKSYHTADDDYFGFGRLTTYYLYSGSLTKLSLTNVVDVPLASVLSCPNLKILQLSHCSSAYPDCITHNSSFNLKYLVALEVENVSVATLACCKNLDTVHVGGLMMLTPTQVSQKPFPTLKRLVVRTKTLDMDLAGPEIYFYYPTSLDELTIKILADDLDEPLALYETGFYYYMLPQIKSLNTLRVHWTVDQSCDAVVRAIDDILRQIVRTPNIGLTSIRVVLFVNLLANISSDIVGSLQEWEGLAYGLTQAARGGRTLQDFNLRIVLSKHELSPSPRGHLRQHLRSHEEAMRFQQSLRSSFERIESQITFDATVEIFTGVEYIFPNEEILI